MSAPTSQDQQAIVQAAVNDISHIATLPEITLRIIELVEDPTSTAQDLHTVISNDPALCSRILKVVNSAFYGLPRQIGSINRAIVLLGLNAVKNIAIAASLAKLFRGGDLCPQFNAKDLWTHSVATASASKLICDELKLGLPDEAFLAGLMHDIGILVAMQSRKNDLIQVFNEMEFGGDGCPATDMMEVEQRVLGADHQQFGAALCEAWKFPKSFSYVTGHHHHPESLPAGSRVLTLVVAIADRISADAGYGFRADLMSTEINSAWLVELGMNTQQLENVRNALQGVYEEVEATFG